MAFRELPKFNPDGEYVVCRVGLFRPDGTAIPVGTIVTRESAGVNVRRLRQLYEQRKVGLPANYVAPSKARRVPNYDAILAQSKINAAERDRQQRLQDKRDGFTGGVAHLALIPDPKPVKEEVPATKVAETKPEPVPERQQPVAAEQVEQPAVVEAYSPEDMGLDPAPVEPAATPKPGKKSRTKKRG